MYVLCMCEEEKSCDSSAETQVQHAKIHESLQMPCPEPIVQPWLQRAVTCVLPLAVSL